MNIYELACHLLPSTPEGDQVVAYVKAKYEADEAAKAEPVGEEVESQPAPADPNAAPAEANNAEAQSAQ